MLNISDPSHNPDGAEDPYGRTPFSDPALDGVECLTGGTRTWLTYHRQMSKIAADYGIPAVMRWVPRNVCSAKQGNVRCPADHGQPKSLNASGADMVYAQAVLAIVGGLALEKGGAVANKVAKERILEPLGMKRKEQSKLRRSQ